MLSRILVSSVVSMTLFAGTAAADNLADIYELALQNDPTIRAARASYRAGLEADNIVRSALLPQISGQATYSKSWLEQSSEQTFVFGSDTGGLGGDTLVQSFNAGDQTTTTESYEINLTQKVFDLSAWFEFQRGQELTAQAKAQFAADQQDLIIRVAEAYFEVLRAIDNLNASQARETAAQRQLEQTRQRFEVGLIAITDVHEAQSQYDLAVATRLADEGALGVALQQLSVLTGRDHANLWLLQDNYPIARPEPLQPDEWVQFALQHNYDIQVAAFARDAAHEAARASKAEHLPTVSAQLGWQDSTSDGDFDSDIVGRELPFLNEQRGPTASINLTIPLYTGGFTSASRRQAYAEYNRAVEQYAGAVRNAIQDTRALYISVVTDVAQTNARRQAIISSESALEATEAGYEVGTRNIVDVLNAQETLYNAIREFANVRYDYVLDKLRLKRTAGTLSPEDIYNLNQWLEPPPPPTQSDPVIPPGLSDLNNYDPDGK